MRIVVMILSLFIVLGSSAQTSFTLTENTNQIIRPGAGAHLWIEQNAPYGTIDIPTQGSPQESQDYYYRVSINVLFGTGIGDSSFDDTFYRSKMRAAILKKQRVRWRWMTICTSCGDMRSYGGASSYYPQFLHNLMSDWISTASGSSIWIPDYNDPDYIRWVGKIHQWVRNYNDTASINGISFKNVLRVVDLGFVGNYSEWHHGDVITSNTSEFPVGKFPTTASFDSIIIRQVWPYRGISQISYVAPMAVLDAVYLNNTNTPVAVSQFYLDVPDSLGIINDHIFDTTTYSFQDPPYFENNNRMGESYRQKILYRYKSAPWGGEPPGGTTNPANFAGGVVNTQFRHYSWFGNGNMPYTSNSTAGNNFRAASAAAGWRMVATSGTMTTTLTELSSFNVTINWQNKGVAPIYDNWQVVYQLRNSSDVVLQSFVSSFTPRLFQPSTSATTFNENFSLASVGTGSTFKLTVQINDITGYLQSLPLNITNTRLSDGAYVLRTGITVNPAVIITPTYNTKTPAIRIKQSRF